jgi:HAE1 family hydrophobic/amphiphilic exporter-1
VRLSDVSIRRPVFAVMLIGGLVALGLVSIPRLGVDLWPRVEFPLVVVQTVLAGAAPETVEQEVTEPLEEAVNTIDGIRSLRSSSSDSLSLLFVEFELEHDIQEKAQQVRERVSAIANELPGDVEAPVVDRVDPDAQPILSILIAAPASIREVSELADKRVKSRLERVPGVGSVRLVGDRARELRIWIDPVRLAGYGLAVDEVLSALRREHVELPAGRIETSDREYSLKTEGKLANAEEFASVVVASKGGRVVHLRDVATVEDGLADERTLSSLGGKRGVALLVRRQSGENTVRVVDAVQRELEAIRADLPPGFEVVTALDASTFIRNATFEVVAALAWGALLASFMVLLFLRSVRSTAIVAVTIPSSIVATFIFFYFFGFTINSMTLMALSLSIGLLIDDAVVVLENVYRHMEGGKEPARAASEGSDEVGLAVIATTLSVAAVFVPIAFLSGVIGRFFREFGLVACCAVGLSTLIALTLTPMLCARYVRVRPTAGRRPDRIEGGYAGLERLYRRVLEWGLAHRPSVVAIAIGAFALGVGLAAGVPVNFVTADDRSEFNVWIKAPLGTSLEATQRTVGRVEALIQGEAETEVVFVTIGAGSQQRVNEAHLYTRLVHKRRRDVTQQEFMVRLRQKIAAADLPLEDYAVEEIGMISFIGSRHSDFMYSVRGPQIERLQFFARTLMERMRASGGYADLSLSYELGKPEIALEITRERAGDLGVPAERIARTISALYAGIEATTFEDAGERYDVRLQIRPEDRDELGKLDLVRVRAAGGGLVPLRNLVVPRVGSGPVQIDRENRSRVITLYGNLAGKSANAADREISAIAEQLGISGEYEFAATGPSRRLRETGAAIRFAFGMALLAIYMILAAQFNSFVHPLTIMLSAPLSFVGAFAALRLVGSPIDLMGQITFLMLMGIVMKNGILLVDYTNTLRERGRPLREAVLEAGPVRMRPVLMTALSTIFGMLPLAIGAGDGSEWRAPMGIIAIGGLATSTLLTLIVVPVAYTLVDDAQTFLVALASRLARKASGA